MKKWSQIRRKTISKKSQNKDFGVLQRERFCNLTITEFANLG
jgi:hypothetical protein